MTPLLRTFNRWLSGQAARPRGPLAPLVGWWLAYENRDINIAALRALGPVTGEHILEVGCGPGWALARLASSGAQRLAAVDPSPEMVRRASHRTARVRRLARTEDIEVICAPAEALPFSTESFDAAVSVNAVYFWQPPLTGLKELRRVLRPGGRLVLAAEAPERLAAVGATAANGFGVLAPDALCTFCETAGFDHVVLAPLGVGRSSNGTFCITAVVPPVPPNDR